MKLYGILFAIVAVILLVCPLAAVTMSESSAEEESNEVFSEAESAEEAAKADDSDSISVFMTEDSKAETLKMRDYIIGAVGAEMPAAYNEEALKAQALAAVTFAEYMKEQGGDDSLSGAVVSDDSTRHQGYMSPDDMREKWGDAFKSYYEKITSAVDAVIDKVITYNGKPIMAAYHAISPGKTESAKEVWGKDVPYLQSVISEGDKESPRYESTVTLTEDEVKKLMFTEKGAEFSEDPESWIKINGTTDSGTVTSVTVAGVEMTGLEMRSLFGFRSPVFESEYSDGSFTFTVKGYGHGVGMSQYGADYYAKKGMTYDEIITHYYTGVEIKNRVIDS